MNLHESRSLAADSSKTPSPFTDIVTVSEKSEAVRNDLNAWSDSLAVALYSMLAGMRTVPPVGAASYIVRDSPSM